MSIEANHPYRMAQALHRQYCDDVFEAQIRIVQTRALIATFGDNALPANFLIRHMNNALTIAFETNERQIATDLKAIDEKLAVIRDLEAMFALEEQARMEAFAEWARKQYGMDKPGTVATKT